jgi:hypothetical protein
MLSMRILLAALLLAGACPAAEWKQLFNGKDLAGWEHVGPGSFTVEDGLLKPQGGMGLLWYTPKKFGNTTIRVVFKTLGERDNSGVYIRFPEQPKDPWYAIHNGYEVQIDSGDDDWHCTGAIYSLSKVARRNQKPKGEWNTLEITLKGQKETVVKLNGEQINDYVEGAPVPARTKYYEPVRGPRSEYGYIGLQNHDANTNLRFKEVSVLE